MTSDTSGLWVERLSLTNYRNYPGVTLEATARPQVIAGANGSGKTNLLGKRCRCWLPGKDCGARRSTRFRAPEAMADLRSPRTSIR